MEFKFKIKRWCPNFKGKSLNFNTFLNIKDYSLKDIEYLAYQNHIMIIKIIDKKPYQSNILEYKKFILENKTKNKDGKTDKDTSVQTEIEEVEKMVKQTKKGRNKKKEVK